MENKGDKKRVVTCVYCGYEYPDGTPTSQNELLTAHIKVCEKHPMREAEKKIELLRNALVGLIGVSETVELQAMEIAIRSLCAPAKDTKAMIDAIHALLSLNEIDAKKGGAE